MYEKPNYGIEEVIFSTAVFHDEEGEYMNETVLRNQFYLLDDGLLFIMT